VFGAVAPALTPLLINFVDSRADVLVPAQAWFGPPAFLCYLLMRRAWGPERTMKQFLDSADVAPQAVAGARPAAGPDGAPAQGTTPADVPVHGTESGQRVPEPVEVAG
jgi:hypothetical protein